MPLTREQQTSLDGKSIDWKRLQYVEPAETLDAVAGPGGLLVDTRVAAVYDQGHYPGAAHAREQEQLLALPKDQSLFLYCT